MKNPKQLFRNAGGNLAISLLVAIAASIFAPALSVAAVIGGSATVIGAASAVQNFAIPAYGNLAWGAIDISDIVTEWGALYRNEGQGQTDIITKLSQKRTLPNFSTLRIVNGTQDRMGLADLGDVLQPYKNTFSPNGDPTFTAIPINLYKCKADLEFNPDDIEPSWLGFLSSLTEADRSQWPITRYIAEVLIPKAYAKNAAHADWSGEQAAAPGGATAGSALAAYTGFRKLTSDGINDGSINEVTLTNDPGTSGSEMDALEEFVDALPSYFEGEDVVIMVSPKLYLNYYRDRRNTHGANTNYGGNYEGIAIDGRPTFMLQSFPGMGMAGNDDAIVAAPKADIIRCIRDTGYRMGMDTDTRTVRIFMDWWEGLGYRVNDHVYAYLPEGSASGA